MKSKSHRLHSSTTNVQKYFINTLPALQEPPSGGGKKLGSKTNHGAEKKGSDGQSQDSEQF